MKTIHQRGAIACGIALALGAASAHAVGVNDPLGNYSFTTDHANFTMLSALAAPGTVNGVGAPVPGGATVGGTNDVNMVWDGDAFTDSSDYTGPGSHANVTASSTTAFFGHNWTAHDIQVFMPGTYSFDTSLGGGAAESGYLTGTVLPGQFGIHMLFDWNGTLNIDVFVIANMASMFGSGAVRSENLANCDQTDSATAPVANCLWDGPAIVPGYKPTANQVWMLAATDGNGDGIVGIPMAAGGPFAGFNAGFNANMDVTVDISDIPGVPIPAAAVLLGSGLLGLIGISGRKRRV